MIKDRTEASGVPNIFIGHNFDHYSFINVRESTEKQIGMSLVNEAEAVVAETIRLWLILIYLVQLYCSMHL